MNMILVFLSLPSLLSFVVAANQTYLASSCLNSTFNTDNTFQTNLQLFLANLARNASIYGKYSDGFYNATQGDDPDKLYALFLCRGDVDEETCQNCVNVATKNLTEDLCPISEQSIIWYDECLFRYSNEPFFSTMSTTPGASSYEYFNNYSDTGEFGQLVKTLLNETTNEAVNTSKMFAARNVTLDGFQTLSGLVQCTRDLSNIDCHRCLQNATAYLESSSSFGLTVGGRVMYPSCNLRYKLYPFYNGAEPPTSATPPTPMLLSPPPPASKGRKTIWIAIGATGSSIIVTLLLGSFLL